VQRTQRNGLGSANSVALNFEAQDFAGFAFGEDIEGAAADFAVGGEALLGERGVHDEIEFLAAEGALDWCGDFHNIWPETGRLRSCNVFEFEREANWFRLRRLNEKHPRD